MKRKDLLKHLFEKGCRISREGASHTIVVNPVAKVSSSVPRHREINEFLGKKYAGICKWRNTDAKADIGYLQ